jgi:hypothetical protein
MRRRLAFIIVDYPSSGQPSTDPDGDPFSATGYIVDGELTPYDSRGALDEPAEESGAFLQVGEPYPLDILLRDWPNATDDYVLTYPSSIVVRHNGSVFPSGSAISSLSTGFEIEAVAPVSNAVVSLDWTAGWNGGMVDRVLISAEVVDLDSDANNDGWVNSLDDPIEANNPGQVFGVNFDDDDANDQSDLTQNAQVVAEDDLIALPFAIGTMNLPGALSDWKATVTMSGTAGMVRLWGSADKSSDLPTNGSGQIEWALSSAVSSPLYVEGLASGTATITLTLANSVLNLAAADTVSVAAVTVTLDIYDGQGGALAPKKSGAFTVANINDTDGDGRMDSHVTETDVKPYSTTISSGGGVGSDAIVVASVTGLSNNDQIYVGVSQSNWERRTIADIAGNTIYLDAPLSSNYAGGWVNHGGQTEHDLMKLVIMPPSMDLGGNMQLIHKSGPVDLWSDPWKGSELSFASFPVSSIPPGGRTIWVEAYTYSSSVRDIELELVYLGAKDSVKATAVWALNSATESSTRSAANVLNDPVWSNMAGGPRTDLQTYGGTGIRPGDPQHGWRNVIAIHYTILPANVWSEPRVSFDITRQANGRVWEKVPGTPWVLSQQHSVFAPPEVEFSNDDLQNGDESSSPTANGRFYVVDTPGIGNFLASSQFHEEVKNFREWVRMGFGGRPAGNRSGSAASDFVLWSSQMTLEDIPGTNPPQFKRSQAGNAIGTGHRSFPVH